MGVEIPGTRVGAVLRSLGLRRAAADPETIFRGVLSKATSSSWPEI